MPVSTRHTAAAVAMPAAAAASIRVRDQRSVQGTATTVHSASTTSAKQTSSQQSSSDSHAPPSIASLVQNISTHLLARLAKRNRPAEAETGDQNTAVINDKQSTQHAPSVKSPFVRTSDGRVQLQPEVVSEPLNDADPTTANKLRDAQQPAAPTVSKKRKATAETTGKQWFDLPATELTPEVRRDLSILYNRHVVDPKHFFKRSSSKKPTLPKFFHMGTVIADPSEYYSSRLTKKQRRTTLTAELLADKSARKHLRKKYSEVQRATKPMPKFGKSKQSSKGGGKTKRK